MSNLAPPQKKKWGHWMNRRRIPHELEHYTDRQVLSIYNSLSVRPVSGFLDRDAMLNRAATLLDARNVMTSLYGTGLEMFEVDGVYVYQPMHHPVNRTKSAEIYTFASQTIKLLVEKNPKSLATPSGQRFALYKDGMTILDYVSICYDIFGHYGAQKAVQDVDWDRKKGFIRLESTDEVMPEGMLRRRDAYVVARVLEESYHSPSRT